MHHWGRTKIRSTDIGPRTTQSGYPNLSHSAKPLWVATLSDLNWKLTFFGHLSGVNVIQQSRPFFLGHKDNCRPFFLGHK